MPYAPLALLAVFLALPAHAQLDLPESRDARVALPDLTLPVAGAESEPRRLVSLADLRGEKYILHVFASW